MASDAHLVNSKLKLNGNQVEMKKTKMQCWDCREFGHWGGDARCSEPGAGLFKPKAAGKRPTAQKHVKVVDSLNTEHVLDAQPTSNEINMVHVPGLSRDKVLMGALDSATLHAIGPVRVKFGFSIASTPCNMHPLKFKLLCNLPRRRNSSAMAMGALREAA